MLQCCSHVAAVLSYFIFSLNRPLEPPRGKQPQSFLLGLRIELHSGSNVYSQIALHFFRTFFV